MSPGSNDRAAAAATEQSDEAAAVQRLHAIMHGNNAAILHVLPRLEDKDLLSALCVSRQWHELASDPDDPHGLEERAAYLRHQCAVFRNAPGLLKIGLPDDLEDRMAEVYQMAVGEPPDESYDDTYLDSPPSEWLSCEQCRSLVRTIDGTEPDEEWRCICKPCYRCTEWFTDLYADDLCKDCWAEAHGSPRPPAVPSFLSAKILGLLRGMRGYNGEFDRVLHDRCTYCDRFVRVSLTGKRYGEEYCGGFEECRCEPCRRCMTWFNVGIDDEATRPCIEKRCPNIFDVSMAPTGGAAMATAGDEAPDAWEARRFAPVGVVTSE